MVFVRIRTRTTLSGPSLPVHKLVLENSKTLLQAVLCAGLYPHVAAMDKVSLAAGHGLAGSGKRPRWTDGHVEVAIHPSSVNHMVTEFKRPFLVFHEKVQAQWLSKV